MTQTIGLMVRPPNTTPPERPRTSTDCMAHFARLVADDLDARKAFSERVGLSYHTTVYHWFQGNLPRGTNAFKMIFALEAFGYKPNDFKTSPEYMVLAAKHLAYGLCTLDDLINLTGAQAQKLLRAIRGEARLAGDRPQYIEMYVYDEANQKKLAEYEAGMTPVPQNIKNAVILALNGGIATPEPKPQLAKETPTTAGTTAALTTDEIIAIMGHMIQTMRPFADYLLSDRCTTHDRDKLRDLAEKVGVFDLKNKLVRLCGERARNLLPNG